MPKTNSGEQITWKEFFHRWKLGMEGITPLQQCKATQYGQVIVVVGIIWGMIYSFLLKQYWLMIVLIGSLIITFMSCLSNWQKKQILITMEKAIQEQMKGGEDDSIKEGTV